MKDNNDVESTGRGNIHEWLTDMIREGACKLIARGLKLEVGELC